MPLLAACEWIGSRFARFQQLDLQSVLIVVPSARTRRRLLQLLCDYCERKQVQFYPPEVITVGSLPERLYENEQPFADEATQLVAWMDSFQSLSLAQQREFLPGIEANDFQRAMEFATQLQLLHTRLATEVKSFASVLRHLESHPESGDIQRWSLLEQIQSGYYQRLNELGFWDPQAARNVAIRRGLCRIQSRVLLIGTSDLNEAVKQMLQQVAGNVTALVVSPRNNRQGFDEFGCIVPDVWSSHQFDIPDEKVHIVDRPVDQAFEVLECIRSLNSQFSPDQITIGVPDDSIIPALEMVLSGESLPFRRLEGTPLEVSPPVRLLRTVSEFLGTRDFAIFAQMVRHPDLFSWMSRRIGNNTWLSALDEYQAEYLTVRISLDRPPVNRTVRAELLPMIDVHKAVCELLNPFLKDQSIPNQHTRNWLYLLDQIYGDWIVDNAKPEFRAVVDSCSQLIEALDTLQSTIDRALSNRFAKPSKSISAGTLRTAACCLDLSANETLELALKLISSVQIGDPPNPESIELVGWLDLPFDDAPVMVVTGINEGIVPSNESGTPLLPISLAESLGIRDDDRRLARDIYTLGLITAAREHFFLITGRNGSEGNPSLISRLLLAADEPTFVRRTNAYFSFVGRPNRRNWLSKPKSFPAVQQFKVLPPQNIAPISQLSVTRFRDYLKCPFRFYLGGILRLEAVTDSLREMDGGAFGSLAHDVLEKFGTHEIKDSDNAEKIFQFLSGWLDEYVNAGPGGDWFSSVRIQIESLRVRLKHFATAQAAHRASGWQILAVENSAEYRFDTVDGPFTIKGRIDRIDRHDNGTLAVWDYKTSDRATTAEKAHRDRTQGWIDLQLPLYRYLLTSLFPECRDQLDQIQMGYVLLPKTTNDIKFDPANWSPGDLREADDLALIIIRKIIHREFWPPNHQPPEFSEQFAGICQDRIFESGVQL